MSEQREFDEIILGLTMLVGDLRCDLDRVTKSRDRFRSEVAECKLSDDPYFMVDIRNVRVWRHFLDDQPLRYGARLMDSDTGLALHTTSPCDTPAHALHALVAKIGKGACRGK